MTESNPTVEGGPILRPGAWGWGLCWLMFASTMLNYMDRQAIALVAPQVKGEFGLNNEGFGWVLAVFSLAYAVSQIPAGYLADRWDVRWTYAGAVAWWSLAGMMTAVAPGLGMLLVLRAALGVGESFNWPCALRVTARVLPPGDRGLGNGIFNSGAAVGAVLTPLLVPLLALRFGWRASFLVVGALGFLWVGAWLGLLGGRDRSKFAGRGGKPAAVDDLDAVPTGLSSKARAAFGGLGAAALLVALSSVRLGLPAIWWGVALLMVGSLVVARLLPAIDLKGSDWAESLGEVVRLRRFWALAAVATSINVCWHFLVNWLPTYLKEDREMAALVAFLRRVGGESVMQGSPRYLAGAILTALIFLFADLGNLGGGAASLLLARRRMAPERARMAVMAACAVLISGGAWVGRVRSDLLVIALLGAMAMGTAAFMANYFAFCQDVAPRHTGLVVGYLGGLGNLFVAAFLPVAGKVKDVTGGFGPVFVVAGLLPFVGLGALAWGWGAGRKPS